MEEERREVYQEQQATESSEAATQEPQRRGGFSVVSFILGLIIGAFVMFAITYATWKIPLDSANEQVKALEAQVQSANQRAEKVEECSHTRSGGVERSQRGIAGNFASRDEDPASPNQRRGADFPCKVMGESEHAIRNLSTLVPKLR